MRPLSSHLGKRIIDDDLTRRRHLFISIRPLFLDCFSDSSCLKLELLPRLSSKAEKNSRNVDFKWSLKCEVGTSLSRHFTNPLPLAFKFNSYFREVFKLIQMLMRQRGGQVFKCFNVCTQVLKLLNIEWLFSNISIVFVLFHYTLRGLSARKNRFMIGIGVWFHH